MLTMMGGCLLRGQLFQNVFEELQAGDGIEGIVILDNNILIATATTEQFRDWVCSYCCWNTGESFRKIF